MHVLVCSDFYSKSALGEMWVKCIKCTGWSHSDGSSLYVYDICQDQNTVIVICSATAHYSSHCMNFSVFVQWRRWFIALIVFLNFYFSFLAAFEHALFLPWMCLMFKTMPGDKKRHFKCECLAPYHKVWLLISLRSCCIWIVRFIPAIIACLRSCNRLPHDVYSVHGVNCYTWHHLTFHSFVWIFLVCLLGLIAEGCSKTSANFLCCSYCTLVVILIYVKIVTTLPGLPYFSTLFVAYWHPLPIIMWWVCFFVLCTFCCSLFLVIGKLHVICGWKHCPEEAYLNRWAKRRLNNKIIARRSKLSA